MPSALQDRDDPTRRRQGKLEQILTGVDPVSVKDSERPPALAGVDVPVKLWYLIPRVPDGTGIK